MPTSAQTEFAENDCESIAFYRWVDVGIDPFNFALCTVHFAF